METVKTNKIMFSSRNFLLFFLICNPLIEIIYAQFTANSAGVLNINKLLRFTALFAMLIDIKSIKALKNLFCIALIFILSYIGVITVGEQLSFGSDISYLLKIYMGFVVYYYFYEKIIEGKLTESSIFNCLIYASIIVSVVVLLGYIGIGSLSYNSGRYGHKGLFSIVCTPSTYLLIVLPLAIKWNKQLKWIAIILSCAALPSLGTKAGVIGLVMLFIIVYCYNFKFRMKKSTAILMMLGSILGIILAFVLVYIYIPYLKSIFLSRSYYHSSFYSFILSNRDTQAYLAQKYYENIVGAKKLLTFLCGSGYSRIENVLNSTYKGYFAIEMDFHAIFFCCGAVILMLVLYRIIYALKIGFENWRHTKLREDFYLLLALSIATVNAWLGGHTLTDSMCIFPVYIIMAMISSRYVMFKNKNNIAKG